MSFRLMRLGFRNRLVLLLSALALPCFGGEIFHLSTGFILEAKSHAQVEGNLVLTTASGTLVLPAAAVTQVEYLPDPEPDKTASVPASPVKADVSQISPVDLLRAAAATQGSAPQFLRFVQSVAWVESGYRADAVSPKGAVGMMQLMPATARDLGVRPADPTQNAEGGARYLRQLLERYSFDSALALAAYNAGPAAVRKFGGIPPFAETRQYVRKVLREYAKSDADSQLSASGAFSATRAITNTPTSTKSPLP